MAEIKQPTESHFIFAQRSNQHWSAISIYTPYRRDRALCASLYQHLEQTQLNTHSAV